MNKEMMNTKEVAEYLGINEKHVYKLTNDRKIPGTKITGKWLFPKGLIDEWINKSAKEFVGIERKKKGLENHIVFMGSNDFTVDILSYELTRRFPIFSLSSSNVGSIGGLIALGRGNCHIAGCHLFDPDTNEYNLPYLLRYLPEFPVKVVNLVYRSLGLIVKSGNPLKISSIKNFQDNKIKIINRQEGSGTRIILDHKLMRLGIDSNMIDGYEREVNTHTEVAVAVFSGAADVGLGILPASNLLGLGFIPITWERFDLIIPEDIFSTTQITHLHKVINSPEFKAKVNQMEGYDTRDSGKIMSHNN